jgi:MFS superfamily sulfate permease-like transporter
MGLVVIGDLPSGLPSPSWLAGFSWAAITRMLPSALILAVVITVESVSVAKQFAGTCG